MGRKAAILGTLMILGVFLCVPVSAQADTLQVTSDTQYFNSEEVDSNQVSISDATVTLSKSTFTYDGKKHVPTVEVALDSEILTEGTDYSIGYKGGTKLGTSYVTVTGEGSYTGEIVKSYTICLATPSLSKAANSNSGVKVSWKKVTGAKGYYIYRKTTGSKWKKIGTVKSGSKVAYTDKKAVKGKTYRYTVKAYNGKSVSEYDTNGKRVKYIGKVAGWQKAYANFFKSYTPTNGLENSTPKFALIYHSGNSIPYLLICDGGGHVGRIKFYTYKNGKVSKFDEPGAAYGTMEYNTGKKTIVIGWFNGFVYANSTNINYILTDPSKVTIS
jgi:hypothetical protein